MKGEIINEFVDKKTLKAMDTLLTSDSQDDVVKASVVLADLFGAGPAFDSITDQKSEGEEKLIKSFHNNLLLLIQKTWVEKSDEGLKAQVLYQLEEFCAAVTHGNYLEYYPQFFEIVDSVVYLMFGSQAKAKDFSDYALRIDPEFGIFWWYMQSLPRESKWSLEKTRVAVLLGMYFLANY